MNCRVGMRGWAVVVCVVGGCCLGSALTWFLIGRGNYATCLLVLDDERGSVGAIALRSDGRVVASGRANGTVQLWDLENRRTIAALDHSRSPVHCVAFSPDGRM